MGRRRERRERREQERQEMLRRHQERYEQETQPPPSPLSESPEMQDMLRDSRVPPQPAPQPPQVAKQRMSTGHKWTLALVVVLVLVLVAPRACRWIEEASCASDGGRVITHTLTGRKACDKPPYADTIFDLGSNDYWLE